MLRKDAVDTVIVCGVFVDGCAGRTADDAYEHDFEVVAAKDASTGLAKEKAVMMLRVTEEDFEQRILGGQSIMELLGTEGR